MPKADNQLVSNIQRRLRWNLKAYASRAHEGGGNVSSALTASRVPAGVDGDPVLRPKFLSGFGIALETPTNDRHRGEHAVSYFVGIAQKPLPRDPERVDVETAASEGRRRFLDLGIRRIF
jgi:hypothetical protein